MQTGTVKWFSFQKDFGFIEPDGSGPDGFVHISAVERAGLTELNEGAENQLRYCQRTGKVKRGKPEGAVKPSEAWLISG